MIQVTAHDADDPSYGNSAKLVYTVLDGLPFFSVDPQTGEVGGQQLKGGDSHQMPLPLPSIFHQAWCARPSPTWTGRHRRSSWW